MRPLEMIRPSTVKAPLAPVMVLLLPALLTSALIAGVPSQPPEEAEAYYQFLLGKLSRLDGELGDAADHLKQAAGADSASAIRVALAETYLRMGDPARAIEQARLATEKNPDDVDARRTLAEAYLAAAFKGDDREGSTTKAIVEYQALVHLSPGDQDARLMLGRLFLQDDRPAEALEQFQAVKAAGFEPAQTGLLIARAWLREQKNDEAAAELRAVLAAAPRDFDALSYLCQIDESKGAWPEASELYRRMLALRPSDATLRTRLGYALFRAGKTNEAIDAFRQTIASNPSDPLVRAMLANALRAAGRPGEAIHELQLLLEYHPDDPRTLIEIGRTHESRSEAERALEAYRRALAAADAGGHDALEPDLRSSLVLQIAALELASGNPSASLRTLAAIPEGESEIGVDAAILRIRALVAAGRAAEAVQSALALTARAAGGPRASLLLLEARLAADPRPEAAAQAAAEFSPSTRPVREIAGAADVLREAGEAKLGLSLFEAALAAHPQDASLQFALGAFHQKAGNLSESERFLRRALELDPNNAQVLNYLGYSLADRGKELAYAEGLIRKALEEEPLSGAYLDSLGWVLVKEGRLPEAEEALLKAADLVAGDGTVREHLGDLYQKKGDLARALAEWKTAQGLKPEDPKRLRKKILSALKETGGR